MPINSTIFITGSVGNGGKNEKQDVMAVQQRLNDLMNPPRMKLVVDGKAGKFTIRMIRDFQKGAAGFSYGDGRVDPNGRTLAALNDPSSEGKWANMSIPPEEALKPKKGDGAALNPKEDDNHEKLQVAVAGEVKDKDYTDKLIDELLKDYGTSVKAMLALLGSADDFNKIAHAIKVLKDLGLNASQSAKVIGIMLTRTSAPLTIALLKDVAASGSKISTALKKLGKPMVIFAVIVTALECYNYFRKGEYGAAAGEIYKLAMGIAVPWAALLDAVQSIIEGLAPSMKGNRAFEATFKVLRAINPLAAGGVAVDTIVTFVQMAVDGVMNGKISTSHLDKLVARMKSGPLAMFAEFGEFLGDKAWDFYSWASS